MGRWGRVALIGWTRRRRSPFRPDRQRALQRRRRRRWRSASRSVGRSSCCGAVVTFEDQSTIIATAPVARSLVASSGRSSASQSRRHPTGGIFYISLCRSIFFLIRRRPVYLLTLCWLFVVRLRADIFSVRYCSRYFIANRAIFVQCKEGVFRGWEAEKRRRYTTRAERSWLILPIQCSG